MTQIFVGNLAYTTSERDLRSTFEHYGRVSSVTVMQDSATGRPRGFAFVGMSRWEDAEEAIARLNGSSLLGRQLVVNEAHSKSNPTPPHRSATPSFWDRL